MKVSQSIKAFDPASDAAGVSVPSKARRPSRLLGTLRKWRGFLTFVMLPTVVTGGYLYGIAAGQYVSEARFLVRGAGGTGGSSVGGALGAALGSAGFKPVPEDAMAIRDYLNSQDALRELRKTVDLVSIWRRPEADPLARLWNNEPTIEFLTRYYKGMVKSDYETDSSTVTIHVRSFRPEDSQALAEGLLRLSEGLVNQLSLRQRGDALGDAQREVTRAENRVVAARQALTSFRQEGRALDPTSESAANMTTVTQMEAALAAARAELREKGGYMRTDNPQIGVVRNRISALENQIGNERQRLTTGEAAAPMQLAGYERLTMERDFADRQLASAIASMETARVDVARQQIYVARITQPQLAESALYPKAAFTVASIFVVLCVVYGIASLILAGFREHAA